MWYSFRCGIASVPPPVLSFLSTKCTVHDVSDVQCTCPSETLYNTARLIRHQVSIASVINESTAGADASVKVQRHEATRSS